MQTCQPLRSQKCILQPQKVYFSHKKCILHASPEKTLVMQPSKAHNLKTESLTDTGTALLDTAFKNTALLKKLDIGSPCAATFEKSHRGN